MIKKAFLIASPQEEGASDYLPGVTPDIHNMENFLNLIRAAPGMILKLKF